MFVASCIISNMENSEIFSLEDDDYGGLFITQESKEDKVPEINKDNLFLGVEETDFESSCSSLVGNNSLLNCHYSDISDEEMDFEQSNNK